MLKNDEEEWSATRAVVSRVIAPRHFEYLRLRALLAPATRYLLYHYNCNEMLRDVTDNARAFANVYYITEANQSLIVGQD